MLFRSVDLVFGISDDAIAEITNNGIITVTDYYTGPVTVTVTDKKTNLSAEMTVNIVTFESMMTFESAALFNIERGYAYVDTTFKNAAGQDISCDSMALIMVRIFSNGLFVNGSGYIDGDRGCAIDVETSAFYVVDDKGNMEGIYCLGTYDVLANPYMTDKTGKQVFKPQEALAGSINSEIYTNYRAAQLAATTAEELPNITDYPYFDGTWSSYLYFEDNDGEAALYGWDNGYITAAEFRVNKDASGGLAWIFESYNFAGTFFDAYRGFKTELRTDEESGERYVGYVTPYQYTASNFTYTKEATSSVKSNNFEIYMTAAEVDAQLRFTKTMFVPYNTKKYDTKVFTTLK